MHSDAQINLLRLKNIVSLNQLKNYYRLLELK